MKNANTPTLKILGGLVVLFLTFLIYPYVSFGQSTSTSNQQEVPTIVAYGDSLVEGKGVSEPESFPGQLDRLLGDKYEIINAGNSGDTTAELRDKLDSRVLSHNPDIVILFGGGSDIVPKVDSDRSRLPPEEIFSNLEAIINELQKEGVTVVLLGHGAYDVPGFTYVDYTDEFQDLANKTNAYFVPDAMDDIALDSKYTTGDLIHPNARGYSLITRDVFPVLQRAIYEEFPGSPLSGSCQADADDRKSREKLTFNGTKNVTVGQQVRWIAYTVGGYGNYKYDWKVNNTNQQSGREVVTTFESEGSKEAQFTVESSNGKKLEETIQCAQTIEVKTAPLKGSCTVNMEIQENEVEINWNADIFSKKTQREYDFEWRINGETVSTSSSFTKTYDRSNTGKKSATVFAKSGQQETRLTCKTRIPEIPSGEDEEPSRTLQSVSCDVNGFDYEVGDKIRWGAIVSPSRIDEDGSVTTTTINWSGTGGLSATSSPAWIVYESPGVKTATAEIDAVTGETTFVSCEAKIVPNTDERTRGSNGEGCFIATAAYGTAFTKEVNILRNFRDTILSKSPLGRTLIEMYYTVSPPIADVIEKSEVLRTTTRSLLQPIVSTTKLAQNIH